MMALVAGAIVLGAGSSWVMGFVPFFLALLLAVGLGAGTASLRGIPLGDLPLPGLTLLVVAQVSYGLGLLGQLGLSRLGTLWRRRAGAPAPSLARGDRRAHEGKTVDPAHHRSR